MFLMMDFYILILLTKYVLTNCILSKSIGHDQRQIVFDHKLKQPRMSLSPYVAGWVLPPWLFQGCNLFSYFEILFSDILLSLFEGERKQLFADATSAPRICFIRLYSRRSVVFALRGPLRCLLSEVSSPEDGSVHVPAGRPGVLRPAAHVCRPAPAVRRRDRKLVWPSLL